MVSIAAVFVRIRRRGDEDMEGLLREGRLTPSIRNTLRLHRVRRHFGVEARRISWLRRHI